MRTNRVFIVLLGATLLLVAGATLWQGIATSQVVSAASDDGPAVGETLAESQGQLSPAAAAVKGPASYRSRQGECYDVPVQEAASCLASAAQGRSGDPLFYRTGPDECFDVPLRETCDR